MEAGQQEIVIARKGLVEADKPLLKDIAGMGVTVTQLSPAERDVFVKATRPVYDKWKSTVGAELVTAAEKSVAERKKSFNAFRQRPPRGRRLFSWGRSRSIHPVVVGRWEAFLSGGEGGLQQRPKAPNAVPC